MHGVQNRKFAPKRNYNYNYILDSAPDSVLLRSTSCRLDPTDANLRDSEPTAATDECLDCRQEAKLTQRIGLTTCEPDLLRRRSKMEDNFVEQVRAGNIEEVETRLKFEDINCKNKKGVSGLYVASQMNNKRMVDFLITHEELNVNAYNKSVPGHTALMIAAELGHLDIVKALLKHPQIQVNITSSKNWTALMYAR